MGRRTRSDEQRLLMWREYTDDERTRLLLAPIPGVGEDTDPLYKYLRRVEAEKRANESTRLLYVATTRARKCLHLLGHTRFDAEDASLKAPDSRSLLAEIWSSVVPEFMTAAEAASNARKEKQAQLEKDRAEKTGEDNPGAEKLHGVPLRRLSADWTPCHYLMISI